MDKDNYISYLNNDGVDNKIKELESYALKNQVPIIQKPSLDFITQIIRISGYKKILEIGSAIGYSAINFALVCDDIYVTTIEKDKVMYQEALKNIRDFNLDNRVKIICQDALDINLTELDKDYDLLFIDAAKSKYRAFFEKFTMCLQKNGIVITDNVLFHDLLFTEEIKNRHTRQLVNKIKSYNDWLKNNKAYFTKFYAIGDGIAVSIKIDNK
ncbi:MAG TPA: O-methyltransferase [Haloplasmataceae bacterium]